MKFEQELTDNDIKEGLVRVARQNLAFFWGDAARAEKNELSFIFPDGSLHTSTITYNPNTGAPRFLKDLRGPLRRYLDASGARVGDLLEIERTPDGAFVLHFRGDNDSHNRAVTTTLEVPESNGLVRPESTGPESITTLPADSSDRQSNPSVPTDEQTKLAEDTSNLRTAEREAVVKVRIGQGDFREALIRVDGEKCWMSGVEGRQLLIASHIRPWSRCEDDPASRGKPDNGLLLSALWDAAFDAGLVTFDINWKVMASSRLTESAKQALGVTADSALPQRFRTDGRREYLAYHRQHVFER